MKIKKSLTFPNLIKKIEDLNITILKKSEIEYIHDQRNTLQHQGMVIPIDHIKYFLEVTFDFIEDFLDKEFQISLKNEIPQRHYDLFRKNIFPKFQKIGNYILLIFIR